MSECLMPYQVAFVMQKDSPYKKRYDQVMTRVQEAGLIKHWYSNEMEKVASLQARSRSDLNQTLEPMTVNHLKGIFALTGLLWAIAISSFLLEVLVDNSNKIRMKCCSKAQNHSMVTSF